MRHGIWTGAKLKACANPNSGSVTARHPEEQVRLIKMPMTQGILSRGNGTFACPFIAGPSENQGIFHFNCQCPAQLRVAHVDVVPFPSQIRTRAWRDQDYMTSLSPPCT